MKGDVRLRNSASLEEYWKIERKSDIFEGCVVYYSGSIKGVNIDPNMGYELVRYMIANGAYVPSAHVGARNKDEMREVFKIMSGEDEGEDGVDPKAPELCYKIDMNWVDEATHVVALVDGPSHGVGMEIMRAMQKPYRGLRSTPILCLVHEDNLEKLSYMVLGATYEYGLLSVHTYSSEEEAQSKIHRFLLGENINEG